MVKRAETIISQLVKAIEIVATYNKIEWRKRDFILISRKRNERYLIQMFYKRSDNNPIVTVDYTNTDPDYLKSKEWKRLIEQKAMNFIAKIVSDYSQQTSATVSEPQEYGIRSEEEKGNATRYPSSGTRRDHLSYDNAELERQCELRVEQEMRQKHSYPNKQVHVHEHKHVNVYKHIHEHNFREESDDEEEEEEEEHVLGCPFYQYQ